MNRHCRTIRDPLCNYQIDKFMCFDYFVDNSITRIDELLMLDFTLEISLRTNTMNRPL